jgi:polyhydroxyalkanoate synthase subunit PhaC
LHLSLKILNISIKQKIPNSERINGKIKKEKISMATKEIWKETVNLGKTTQFYRDLIEIPTEDGMKLIMTHKQPVDKKPIAPIVMVHGLGQNRYSWTLTKRSMENYFISQGFETFNIELRGHGLSRANGSEYPMNFETYLFYDIPAIFKSIKTIINDKKIFYFGHSLGGAISYCIGSQFQNDLAGIVSIAGPYSMGKGNPTLKSLAKVGVLLNKLISVNRFHPEAFYIDFIGVLVKYGLFAIDNQHNVFPVQAWYPGTIERDI